MKTSKLPRPRRASPNRIDARMFHLLRYVGPEGPVVGQYDALVKLLTERRNELGLTQEQLDHKLGLSSGHVGKLEIRTRIPRFDFAMLWAMGLGYDIKLVRREPK